MDFYVLLIMCVWCFRGTSSQCSSANITERIGAIEFSTKTLNNENCHWIFQSSRARRELVFIVKFFHLNQGFRDYLVLPNGEHTSSNTPNNFCRSYVYHNSSTSECWRRKNWSNCPQQMIDDLHWPPKLTVIEVPGETKEEEELSFGLLYAFVDCVEDSALPTSFTTTTEVKTILPTFTTKTEADVTCECDIWKNVIIVLATLSILSIAAMSIALNRECRKNRGSSEEEKEKIFQVELATHAASTNNRENPTNRSNQATLPRDDVQEQPLVFTGNCEAENIYSAIPMSQQFVPNVLYQSYKGSLDDRRPSS